MAQKGLFSVDIAAVIEELKAVVKGKISQIYQQEKELLLQIHVPNQGKQLLRIVAGKLLCLTHKKEFQQQPSSFCLQLRKYLAGAFIKDIYQKEAERIVVLELEKQG